MVAFAETSRPTHRAYAQTCVGSSSCARGKNPSLGVDRNQQYSITALTDGSGTIVERYAYTAYGQPGFFGGSGTVISASAEGNRCTYTGREWDDDLGLYHYRARMYDAVSGRFLGRDPIGFEGSKWGLYEYVKSRPSSLLDPMGLEVCAIDSISFTLAKCMKKKTLEKKCDCACVIAPIPANCDRLCKGMCRRVHESVRCLCICKALGGKGSKCVKYCDGIDS